MSAMIRPLVCVLGILAAAPVAFAHPPSGIAVDDRGRVYFMQAGVGVWMIDEGAKLGMHAGPGFHHVQLDPKGTFLKQRWPSFPDGVIRAVGENPTLLCVSSFPAVISPDGALYYPEAMEDGRVHILRMLPGEKSTDFVMLPVAMEISFEGKLEPAQWIHGLAVGPDKNLYYAEKEGVRRVDTRGVVSTVVDKISLPECVHPPAITDDRGGVVLRGLDVAPDGNIYAASAGCSALLKITQTGEVSVALQERDGWAPTDVAAAGDALYVEEFYYNDVPQASDWRPRVRKLAADGSVTTLATVTDAPTRPTPDAR
jgi:hypothetical protein